MFPEAIEGARFLIDQILRVKRALSEARAGEAKGGVLGCRCACQESISQIRLQSCLLLPLSVREKEQRGSAVRSALLLTPYRRRRPREALNHHRAEHANMRLSLSPGEVAPVSPGVLCQRVDHQGGAHVTRRLRRIGILRLCSRGYFPLAGSTSIGHSSSMLSLSLTPEIETLRADFRGWLGRHPPPSANQDPSLETFQRLGRAWQGQLAAGRWIGVHWPKAYGGRGLSLVEEAVLQEELVRANAPQVLGLFGLTMVGPVLIQHGTEVQKSRYLAKILSGEEIWCQGFSEPGAGSDLAAVKTRARVTPDGFYVSGQKVWTSFAHIANFCFVLCRTSDEGVKHKGLSYLLVDMRQKGIQVRSLKQISGDEEFNEVFFDEVFVPKDQVVGAIGDGWRIAISTLMYERVVLTFARHLQSERALRGLLAAAKDQPELKAALGAEIARACAVRALAYRHLVEYANGKQPGPEGSLDKLFWSESFQSISQLALRAAGARAAEGESGAACEDIHRYLYSRGRTIAAGTSEIQRGIIADRILGLPRGA